jgi:hypothetical protein
MLGEASTDLERLKRTLDRMRAKYATCKCGGLKKEIERLEKIWQKNQSCFGSE